MALKQIIKYWKFEEKWYLIRNCDKNIEHNICTFNKFYKDFIDKNINQYDMPNMNFNNTMLDLYINQIYLIKIH